MEPTLEEMLDSLDESSSIITKPKPGSPADSNVSDGPNATESNDPEGPNTAEPKPSSPEVSDDSDALEAALVEALTVSPDNPEKTCDKPNLEKTFDKVTMAFIPKPSSGSGSSSTDEGERSKDPHPNHKKGGKEKAKPSEQSDEKKTANAEARKQKAIEVKKAVAEAIAKIQKKIDDEKHYLTTDEYTLYVAHTVRPTRTKSRRRWITRTSRD